MTFYSHSRKNSEGETIGSKRLINHINGVLKNAQTSYKTILNFDFDNREMNSLLEIIVKFHDLGKYTSYFQNYLLKTPPIDYDLKQHARVGALTAFDLLKDKNDKHALIALYIIFLHHSNLMSVKSLNENFNDRLKYIIEAQIEDLKHICDTIQTELDVEFPELKFPEEKLIRRGLKILSIKEKNIQNYFLINYLFSLLIEADKLDASDTPMYNPKPIPPTLVDKRFPIEYDTTKALKELDNNGLRSYCRKQVLLNLDRKDILNHYLFTLTAPTGTGKTMTALDFALKLKKKITASLSYEPQIIYALPFINIIEQGLKEYKKTLKGEANILAHYQYADVFSIDKSNSQEEKNYNQKLMTLDTWQADIVITSFVQFFETLISNRNKLLKKFNHLAGAIIILDEVQTLKLAQMPLLGATIYYLTKFMKSRVILMTATKPKIFDLANTELLSNENEKAEPLELLQEHSSIFQVFERTKIVPLLSLDLKKENRLEKFIDEVFSAHWNSEKSYIIVCNTVNRSIEVFSKIRNYLKTNSLSNPLYYLSTNIVPAHRLERIEEIRKKLENNESPILVSTQVVEAGVDLDFDMGFRDIGPVDSIIQVAGRINRNNKKEKYSPLYIIDFGDAPKIYGKITYTQAIKALSQKKEYLEGEYLEIIDTYFDAVSDKSSFDDYNKIFDAMKCLRYDGEREEYPVSRFKVIEESNSTQSVFIELGDEEVRLREMYFQKIIGQLSKEEFDKNYKQAFQQRVISVPGFYTQDLPFINEYEENLKVTELEVINQYYDSETGFLRTPTPESETFML